MIRKSPKLLLIGWDAADWKFIHPLMDAGLMPTLEKLVESGVMGNIQTLDPPLSPMLWTSIATGKTADQHGILGFVEPHPETGAPRPVTTTSRKVKALWNILTHEGFKTHVVGWWPSHPAEPINGICVSNHFAQAQNDDYRKQWDLSPQHVHPQNLFDELSNLRIHPSELTWVHLSPFLPKGAGQHEGSTKMLNMVAILLAQCSTYHAVTTWILENQEWDFCALYMDTIDKAGHEFMKYHPPLQSHIYAAEFELYKEVMNSFYRYHDMMLERLLELAGEDATVMMVSDHGFYSDHRRLEQLPKDPMAPALEHSPYGIFCLKGNGIKKDERVYGTTLLDITPTVLHLFGLPVGKDMPGKVVTQAFEEPQTINFIDSWEKVEGGNFGVHPEEMREDPWAAQDALKQLAELGYIEPLSDDITQQIASVHFESQFNLARVHLSFNRLAEALEILENLNTLKANIPRVEMRLINCYLRSGRTESARTLLNNMRNRVKGTQTPFLDFLEGKILLAEHRPLKALEYLAHAAKAESATADLHVQLGNVYIMLREWKKAEISFQNALNLDIENAAAHHGISIAFLRQEKYEDAVEEALSAVGIQHFLPGAHYHLGEALFNLKEYEHAIQAFEMAISMQPANKRARIWLLEIYTKHLPNTEKAEKHQLFLKNQMRPKITLVSGLPRSGTSMMMQMLKAGGSELLIDDLRQSDDNNPHGYMEYEPVKRLHQDNLWLKNTDGKTVKIIAQLLPHLHPECDYNIVFMERTMEEVLSSQQKMLGKAQDKYPAVLAASFQKQLEKVNSWIKGQPNIKVHYVNYSDVIQNPQEQAENINSFLGGTLNTKAMIEAVSPDLYRNKNR